jgi:hypothetical protein
VTMLALCNTILLMGVRARNVMGDAHLAKKGVKGFVVGGGGTPFGKKRSQGVPPPPPPPKKIGLHRDDFAIEHSFNEGLKLKKILKNFIFAAE